MQVKLFLTPRPTNVFYFLVFCAIFLKFSAYQPVIPESLFARTVRAAPAKRERQKPRGRAWAKFPSRNLRRANPVAPILFYK